MLVHRSVRLAPNRVTPLAHDGRMTPQPNPTPQPTARPEAPQQLSLLPSSSAPLRFRLDRRTRELGLAHIARIRHQLAERAGGAPAGGADTGREVSQPQRAA